MLIERDLLHSYLKGFNRGCTAYVCKHGLRTERTTYAELAATAYRFSRLLKSLKIAKGERILICAANRMEWVGVFFGAMLQGVVIVPLDVESSKDFIERVVRQVQPRLMLCNRDDSYASLGVPVVRLENLLEELKTYDDAPCENITLKPSDIVEIIYTSGTTTEPRGVCLTHRNILANLNPIEVELERYRRLLDIVHPLRVLCLLPLSHVFGQSMGIFIPQLFKGEVHFVDTLNPTEIVEIIRREGISVVALVPRILDVLRDKAIRDWKVATGEDLLEVVKGRSGHRVLGNMWRFRRLHRIYGWKFWAFVSGGASLSPETEQFWKRMGFAVIQGYGMTETSSMVSVVHPFKMSNGSIGRSLPGREVKIVDGELLIRGDSVSVGFWDGGVRPITDSEGWLHTGDIAEFDSQGNLFFRGRKKDVIVNSSGVNIYPEDIERVLQQQPEVKYCAVVAVEGVNGQEPVAVVVLREPTNTSALLERVNSRLNLHQQVRRIEVWEGVDLPRTSTHKVKKHEIARRLQADLSVTYLGHTDLLIAEIERITGRKASRTDPQALLATDFGLDSLSMVELLSVLEDRYQIDIDETKMAAAETLGDLQRLVKGELSSDERVLLSRPGDSQEMFLSERSEYPYPEWSIKGYIRLLRLLLFYALVLPITRLLGWVNVEGKQHLRLLQSPAIFTPNHISLIDHALILSALPWRLRHRLAIGMDGERLRYYRYPARNLHLLHRLLLKLQYLLIVLLFNTFPIPKTSGFRRSFSYAGSLVDRGYSILVFPEGLRSRDGKIRPFKAGIGVLAERLAIPVVPVGIVGLYELAERWEQKSSCRFWAWPGELTIRFGAPISCAPKESPEEFARRLQTAVTDLMF